MERERERNESFGRRSAIIEKLAKYATSELPASELQVKLRLKKKFSLIEEPAQAIELICALAKTLKLNRRIRSINFNHADLEEYDLAANALLDLVAVERNRELRNRQTRKGLRVSGTYPRDGRVRRFIKAMGIIKHMDILHEAPSHAEAEKIRFFDKRNTHYLSSPDAKAPDFKDRVQVKFVDFIDECLQTHRWALSDYGKQSLGLYAGEILANAEDHAGFVDWTVQGYLDNSSDSPTCEIAIFNFGKSIAQTFQELNRDSYAWKFIQPYIERHTAKGLFSPAWRQEDLLTVVALQQHISSKNSNVADSRGQGTVHFIDFFQQVHNLCVATTKAGGPKAKMALISGGTYILFDGTYQLKEREGAGKTIAFNLSGSLEDLPDKAYVKSLGASRFPGTIISVRFSLSAGKMVEELEDGKSVN